MLGAIRLGVLLDDSESESESERGTDDASEDSESEPASEDSEAELSHTGMPQCYYATGSGELQVYG